MASELQRAPTDGAAATSDSGDAAGSSEGADAGDAEFHDMLGAWVRLHGLSRTELNGLVGRVLSWHPTKGRAGVKVHGREGALAVRPANLERVTPADVADAAGMAQHSDGDGDEGETLEESWERMQRSLAAGRAERLPVDMHMQVQRD